MPRLSEIARKSIRKYGLNTMTKGEALPVDFPRIPTGIFPLDFATAGGFPAKVTSSIYGPPGGGKSLVLQKLISSSQKICWKCFDYEWDCQCEKTDKRDAVLVCTEIMDHDWARQLGVDIDNLYMVEPDYGEQASDVISEVLQAPDVGLVCLDSLAMLTPLAEIEGSASDGMVATQARLIARMIRRIKSLLIQQKKKDHNVAFVTTNQIRVKIGQMFGNPEEVPGGYASKHDWHLTLRMSQLKSDDMDKQTELPINSKFKASTVATTNKRKLFTLAGTAEFYCTTGEGGELIKGSIADHNTFIKMAKEQGFLEGWNLFDHNFGSKAELLQALISDEQLYLTAKKRLVEDFCAMAKMNAGV